MATKRPKAEDQVPFYLMPLAAILGLYALCGILYTLYLFYTNYKNNKKATPRRIRSTKELNEKKVIEIGSTSFIQLIVSIVVASIFYSFVVAKIERTFLEAEYALFDPYEILGISSTNSNTTVVKKAYMDLVKIYHPDNKPKGDQKTFNKLTQAYQSLTDERSIRNYKQYGHPDGPLSTPTFQLSLPNWLLYPEGTIAIVIMILYLIVFIIVIGFAVKHLSDKEDEMDKKEKAKAAADAASNASLLDNTNSVSVEDLNYLSNRLKPDSNHMQILMTIISTPENIEWSIQDLQRVEKTRKERLEKDKKEKLDDSKKTDTTDFDDLFNSAGWADDNDDNGNNNEDIDDQEIKFRKAEEEKKREMERLKRATGQAKVLLEDIDDGVLGQKWVERTLEKHGAWPPKSIIYIKDETFTYEGQVVQSPLEHPGLRRILCMTIGRLNSTMLNSHPELLDAGTKNLIDQTYFKASMEFRNRVGMLLEASLRLGMSLRSKRLVSTIVETVAMFKIGVEVNDTRPNIIPWFNNVMLKQYNVLPRLNITNKLIQRNDDNNIVITNNQAEVVLEFDRQHAENFTKQKIESFKKQGIPPQVGLQAYREGWWFTLCMKRLDGDTIITKADKENNGALKDINIDPKNLDIFDKETPENRLLTAWPMIVQRVAQQKGKVKIQFKTPNEPGEYRFYVSIKSQDFFGADQELQFDINIIDDDNNKEQEEPSELVVEKSKEEEEEEPKKDK